MFSFIFLHLVSPNLIKCSHRYWLIYLEILYLRQALHNTTNSGDWIQHCPIATKQNQYLNACQQHQEFPNGLPFKHSSDQILFSSVKMETWQGFWPNPRLHTYWLLKLPSYKITNKVITNGVES